MRIPHLTSEQRAALVAAARNLWNTYNHVWGKATDDDVNDADVKMDAAIVAVFGAEFHEEEGAIANIDVEGPPYTVEVAFESGTVLYINAETERIDITL